VSPGPLVALARRALALVVGLDALLRASSNPFFCYVAGRVDEGLGPPGEGARPCVS
jgi:hypothetical protein